MAHAQYDSRSVDMLTGYTVLDIMQINVRWLRAYTRIYDIVYSFVYSIFMQLGFASNLRSF